MMNLVQKTACWQLVLLGLALAQSAPAAKIDATWTFAGDGPWNTAGYWSTDPDYPNNNGTDQYNVFIDGGETANDVTVTLNVTATVDELTVDAGDALAIPNGRAFTVAGGTIENDGAISLDSTGSSTYLTISASTMLAGSGRILMSYYENNVIRGTAPNQVLTSGVDHTIEGAGRLGNNSMGLINNGLIQATQFDKQLIVDPSDGNVDGRGADVLNAGTMQASGGARCVSTGVCLPTVARRSKRSTVRWLSLVEVLSSQGAHSPAREPVSSGFRMATLEF